MLIRSKSQSNWLSDLNDCVTKVISGNSPELTFILKPCLLKSCHVSDARFFLYSLYVYMNVLNILELTLPVESIVNSMPSPKVF